MNTPPATTPKPPATAPTSICVQVPSCPPITIHFPLGIPPLHLDDPFCAGLDLSIAQLNQGLMPMIPFFNLFGCAMDIVSIVLAIPKAIGPPPDISQIQVIVQKSIQFASSCIPMLVGYLPVGIAPSIAVMMKSLCQYLIALLNVLAKTVTVNNAVAAEALVAQASKDAQLRAMGDCLSAQSAQLAQALLNKLGNVLDIFTLMSTIISFVTSFIPGLPNPIFPTFDTSKPMTDPAPIQLAIDLLQDLEKIFAAVP
jgi:hypothetical protein